MAQTPEAHVRNFYALRLLFTTAQRLRAPSARPGFAGGVICVLLVGMHAVRVLAYADFGALSALRPAMWRVSLYATALRPRAVLGGEWGRLATSAAVHLDVVHLVYNVCSFVGFARAMETALGTARFALLVAYVAVAGSAAYVAIAAALAAVFGNYVFLDGSVAGFSGVVFGLITVCSGYPALRPGTENFYGILIPGRWRHWKELVLCKILIPESSLLGHFCGILAGISYLWLRSVFVSGR